MCSVVYGEVYGVRALAAVGIGVVVCVCACLSISAIVPCKDFAGILVEGVMCAVIDCEI